MHWHGKSPGLLMLLPALAAHSAAGLPPPSAIALTFGHGDMVTKTCRLPSRDVAAEGEPEFPSPILRGFGNALGRPVTALDGPAETPDL
jgi:hypothetical protein